MPLMVLALLGCGTTDHWVDLSCGLGLPGLVGVDCLSNRQLTRWWLRGRRGVTKSSAILVAPGPRLSLAKPGQPRVHGL
jgi:hypothetical protein